MAKKKIRLGLIGCGGNMRNAHVPRLQEDGRVELVALVDTAAEPAQLLMEKWGCDIPLYTDYKAMLKGSSLDGVLISSPHSMHYEQARACLRAGLHVLVEKPLTITSRHAKSLIETARKLDRLLVVSYQRNFYPQHAYVRELVRKGAIGEIKGVVAYVTQRWGGRGWRGEPDLAGGGFFMDTGSHLVASTLWMTGLQPNEVHAFMDRRGQKVDIDAALNVRFTNGALGSLHFTGSADRHDERLAIQGDAGCIVFNLHQWGIREVLLNGDPLAVPARIGDDTPDAAFLRWMRGGKGYEEADFALQVSRLTEAAYKSLEQKRTVRVAR